MLPICDLCLCKCASCSITLNHPCESNFWSIIIVLHSFFQCVIFFPEGFAPDDMVLWTYLPPKIFSSSLPKVLLFDFVNYLLWLTTEILIGGKNTRSESGPPDSHFIPYIFDIWILFLWMLVLNCMLQNLQN